MGRGAAEQATDQRIALNTSRPSQNAPRNPSGSAMGLADRPIGHAMSLRSHTRVTDGPAALLQPSSSVR
jgi:hypothetical protein